MSRKLYLLISEGEHINQDFKFCVNDSRKIAKSLVAFANTEGGRLLIGVKDNGKIAGIQSEEEYYMIEAAANLYSRPKIEFHTRQWHAEGKTVLQIDIPASDKRPHYAQDNDGKWLAYFRYNDENILANKIMLEVWKKKKSVSGVKIHFSDLDRKLLHLLEQNKEISLSKFARSAKVSRYRAERILINLISVGVIEINIQEGNIRYQLSDAITLE